MPLRDHFHPPVSKVASWGDLHGVWPAEIVRVLKPTLPPGFVATANISFEGGVEVGIGATETDARPIDTEESQGGLATLAVPATDVEATEYDLDLTLPLTRAYEVRVYDVEHGRQLVAVIELVSPANKDRPGSRRAFAGKCAALLQEGVAVTIVDLVTSRHFNLFNRLMAFVGHPVPAGPPIYVATCQADRERNTLHVKARTQPLRVGRPLPSVTVWLTDELFVTLDLEASYEAACDLASIP